jgi:transketolase
MGDGECNEGSVWEAAMAAAHYRLSNLTAIIDFNGLQSDGPCAAVMNMQSHEEKWRAFGWETRTVNGHDIQAVYEAFTAPRDAPDKPLAIVATTVKGKGVSFMENDNKWHHNALAADQYDAAIQELAVQHA